MTTGLIIVLLLVVIWLLTGIAGALLYSERGFWWGFLGGPVGLAIFGQRQRAEQERAQKQAEADARRKADRARNRPTKSAIRWP
ncbi:MAG: hypothetical protein J2P17_32990, partial [Mycobacterium sp.]|nr:hypothetical protein [Mycobacterium sp.]